MLKFQLQLKMYGIYIEIDDKKLHHHRLLCSTVIFQSIRTVNIGRIFPSQLETALPFIFHSLISIE